MCCVWWLAEGLIDNSDQCTYRWIQQATYRSILPSPNSTTRLISSTSAWFCLRPISSSSSPTKRRRRALPRERKDGRFSTVSSGWRRDRFVKGRKRVLRIEIVVGIIPNYVTVLHYYLFIGTREPNQCQHKEWKRITLQGTEFRDCQGHPDDVLYEKYSLSLSRGL